MNRAMFFDLIETRGQYHVTRERYDGGCSYNVSCYKLQVDGHTIYRVQAFGHEYQAVYRSEEISAEAAADLCERLDAMMSLSHALFSWIEA